MVLGSISFFWRSQQLCFCRSRCWSWSRVTRTIMTKLVFCEVTANEASRLYRYSRQYTINRKMLHFFQLPVENKMFLHQDTSSAGGMSILPRSLATTRQQTTFCRPSYVIPLHYRPSRLLGVCVTYTVYRNHVIW